MPPEVVELRGVLDINSETMPVLEAGGTVLVYARVRSGHWDTTCTRTNVLSLSSDELRQLRQCQ